jgi:23S rRNA (cytidine2498-2'-O)-methyltransferase
VFAYFAFEKFGEILHQELKLRTAENLTAVSDRLFTSSTHFENLVWAQNIWLDAEVIDVASVGDAVKALKARGKWWALYSHDNHRRAQLIQEQLPQFKIAPLSFLGKVPTQPMGAWTLISKNQILAAAQTSSPFPLGEIYFAEDKTPPSRAYLKLWELMTVHGVIPARGTRCLDLGSCPGGWTWVLQSVGTNVVSVDKAPLAPEIAKLPNIEFLKKDAFALKPADIGPIDWLFSDVICYPARLYELVEEWRTSGLCQNFACTIKFQGKTDWETMEKFLKIPGSRILHLFYNKHEVTWVSSSSK